MQTAEPLRPPRLAILADDLTGALDCAAGFISGGRDLAPFVALTPDAVAPDDCGVVSVNADSRRFPADEAVVAVQNAITSIARSGRTLSYVKIDSTLRGHPGLEISECAKHIGASLVIVSPSFPATGRTVRDGTLLVHGEPLADTDVGRDSLSPLETSRVAEVLKRSTNLPVHEVSLDAVRSAGLGAEMSELVPAPGDSPVIVCCDTETDSDLDLLIAAGRSIETHHTEAEKRRTVLFAGSAGLAFALSRSNRSAETSSGGEKTQPFSKPVLVVTASQRELADRQLANLVSNGLAELQNVTFTLGDANMVTGPVFAAEATARALASQTCVALRATISGDLTTLSAESIRQVADRVTGELGQLVARIASEHRLGGIVIIGGDTAHAILTATEARGIVLAAEPLPGVPVGVISGGTLDGVPIATKAGAFGDDQTLVKLIQHTGEDNQQN